MLLHCCFIRSWTNAIGNLWSTKSIEMRGTLSSIKKYQDRKRLLEVLREEITILEIFKSNHIVEKQLKSQDYSVQNMAARKRLSEKLVRGT